MIRFMLDTNAFSHWLRKHANLSKRAYATLPGEICLSALVEGELRFGLSNRPQSSDLANAVARLIDHLEIVAWTSATAQVYATLRADVNRQGKRLAPLDMLIAAHAKEIGVPLITSDRAFYEIDGLALEDWTLP